MYSSQLVKRWRMFHRMQKKWKDGCILFAPIGLGCNTRGNGISFLKITFSRVSSRFLPFKTRLFLLFLSLCAMPLFSQILPFCIFVHVLDMFILLWLSLFFEFCVFFFLSFCFPILFDKMIVVWNLLLFFCSICWI